MSTNNVTNDTGGKRRRGQVGNYRWVICALLFFCTTINYIDRNSLSVLKTTLQGALGWDDVDYGTITTAFTFAYAMFPSVIGIFIDTIRREEGAGRCAGHLVAGGRRAWPGGDGAGLRHRALRPRLRRSRQLPGVDQGGRHVVPAEGAGARHRHLQFRHQHRRHGVVRHRVDRRRTGAGRCRSCSSASSAWCGCTSGRSISPCPSSSRAWARPSSTTSARTSQPSEKAHEGAVDHAGALPRDLAVPDRQAHHRSGVVVLPVLAAVVSRARARPESAERRLVGRRDLHRLEHRLDPRRLAVGHADQARLARGQGAHDDDVARGDLHAGIHPRVLRRQLRACAWRSSRSPPPATRPGRRTCSPTPPTCSRRRCRVRSSVSARPPAASAACS